MKQPSAVSDQQLVDDEQTLADSGFFWREKDGVRVLVCRALEDAGFANGFSTRGGGVSTFPENSLNLSGFDDDSADNIYENRRRFLSVFDGQYKLALALQVHGTDIRVVRTANEIAESEKQADAVISDLRGVLAGAKTADCVPVLLGDTKTRAYAAVHAGWRGTAESFVKIAIARMHDLYGTDAVDLITAIGPAACGRNYEVGLEVIEQFSANFLDAEKYFTPTRERHALVDLHTANRDQLVSAGVAPDSVYIAPFCTIERDDLFFSYRREKGDFGKTGRLLSVIGRL